ncbi:hypothetical protein GDO78_015344 [Eleutherodactylus coqui]|uniref:Uncharacterized protein n=1 Tax=Eleutherodactylus coqui TaxID=57060 RepID=A0A8J6EDQ2_ELECQ|nr:hypothetical protein GDO78_015344 [Eleutherodactylus coqui]
MIIYIFAGVLISFIIYLGTYNIYFIYLGTYKKTKTSHFSPSSPPNSHQLFYDNSMQPALDVNYPLYVSDHLTQISLNLAKQPFVLYPPFQKYKSHFATRSPTFGGGV